MRRLKALSFSHTSRGRYSSNSPLFVDATRRGEFDEFRMNEEGGPGVSVVDKKGSHWWIGTNLLYNTVFYWLEDTYVCRSFPWKRKIGHPLFTTMRPNEVSWVLTYGLLCVKAHLVRNGFVWPVAHCASNPFLRAFFTPGSASQVCCGRGGYILLSIIMTPWMHLVL